MGTRFGRPGGPRGLAGSILGGAVFAGSRAERWCRDGLDWLAVAARELAPEHQTKKTTWENGPGGAATDATATLSRPPPSPSCNRRANPREAASPAVKPSAS